MEEDKKLDDDNLSRYNGVNLTTDEQRSKESKVFMALDNLKQAYKEFPQYKEAIRIVDNEIKWIGEEWGDKNIDRRVTKVYKTPDKLNKI